MMKIKIIIISYIILVMLFISEIVILNYQKPNRYQEFVSKIALGDFALATKFYHIRFNHFSSIFDKKVDYALLPYAFLDFVYGK